MTTITIRGVELFYERSGEGERVLLTHGAWTDGRTWQAVTDRTVDRFEVVTWDRRGHSRSRDGDAPGSVQEDAADLAALIESLGGEPVHAVGNSAGGNVVLNLLASRPDLLKTATVHEPGPFGLLEESEDPRLVQLVAQDKKHTAKVERLIAEGEPRRTAKFFVENVAVGPGAWEQFPDELKTILESNASTVADDFRDGWDIASVDMDALTQSAAQLLISSGSDSPELERAAAHELARRLPSARLETIPGTGHIPHRTHPDVYASLITGFVDESIKSSVS